MMKRERAGGGWVPTGLDLLDGLETGQDDRTKKKKEWRRSRESESVEKI